MEVLGARVSLLSPTLVVAVKTYLHQRDLEGAPTKGAREISTLTRTTGREIDLLLGTSAAKTVISRAIGMTITVEVVVVNRSKYMPHDLGFPIPPAILSKSKKNPPGILGHMP